MARVIVVTSGKGGVGKTTSAAAIATGLALLGKKTVVIDFDVGLRNLDLIMGCERRVVFDFINVINDGIRLHQALIKDKRVENLYVMPTSQTRDKDALDLEGVEKALGELKLEFDYIICDSPAGIEKGAQTALYFADEAVIVTNPEVSSVRDSDRIIGILNSKTRRAEKGEEAVKQHLLLTRYDPARVEKGEMLKVEDVLEILAIPLLGVIPQDEFGAAGLQCRHAGGPGRALQGRPGLHGRGQAPGRRADRDAVHRPRQEGPGPVAVAEDRVRLFEFFGLNRRPPSADTAKQRLQLVIAHDKGSGGYEFLPLLQRELLEVIKKYVEIDVRKVKVDIERGDQMSILELNVELPSVMARPQLV